MKLIYDDKGRLSEILGSGENGAFKEGEVEIFNNYVNKMIEADKEIKLKSVEENRIIQTEISKNQAEMSKASSNTFASFLNAVGSVALAACCCSEQPNQLPPNTQPQASQPEKK